MAGAGNKRTADLADRPTPGKAGEGVFPSAEGRHDLGNLIQLASSGLNVLSRDSAILAAPEVHSVVIGAKSALEKAHAHIRSMIAAGVPDLPGADIAAASVYLEDVSSSVLLGAVRENALMHRFELRIESDLFASAYYRIDRGHVVLIHTEVPNEFAGLGIATRLACGVFDLLRATRRKADLRCSFMRRFANSHPGYADVVAR